MHNMVRNVQGLIVQQVYCSRLRTIIFSMTLWFFRLLRTNMQANIMLHACLCLYIQPIEVYMISVAHNLCHSIYYTELLKKINLAERKTYKNDSNITQVGKKSVSKAAPLQKCYAYRPNCLLYTRRTNNQQYADVLHYLIDVTQKPPMKGLVYTYIYGPTVYTAGTINCERN